jgi:hypothetical protein
MFILIKEYFSTQVYIFASNAIIFVDSEDDKIQQVYTLILIKLNQSIDHFPRESQN